MDNPCQNLSGIMPDNYYILSSHHHKIFSHMPPPSDVYLMNKEPCHVYFALLEDFHQQCFLKAKNLVSAGEPPVGPQGLFIFEQKSLVYLVQQICPQIEMLHLL